MRLRPGDPRYNCGEDRGRSPFVKQDRLRLRVGMTERSDAGMTRLGLIKLSGRGGRLRELEEAGCYEHNEQRGRVNEKPSAAGRLGMTRGWLASWASIKALKSRPRAQPSKAGLATR